MVYRPDIDGLRAVAIGAVVLFHSRLGLGQGGFVGVDVFFVISGFLITSLILGELQRGTFSLVAFYERRVRRLLPAMLPVLAATGLFAWLFYPDAHFEGFAASAIAFITHTANWYFLATSGYFRIPPEVSPLLHGWSLAVEEQFYLVFPILVAVVWRRAPARLVALLALLAVASFAHSCAEVMRGHGEIAFFSTASRLWELMVGALIAVLPPWSQTPRTSALMRYIGVGAIVLAVLAYGPGTPFPGLAALVPVGGAALLLLADSQHRDRVVAALEAPVSVYLGRISYAVFLWHWPVFGMMRVLILDPSMPHEAIGLPIALALAALSYHFVEQPIRRRQRLPRPAAAFGLLAASTATVLMLAAYTVATDGWPGRFDPAVQREARIAARAMADRHRCLPTFSARDVPSLPFCTIGNRDRTNVDLLLWGDSHAASLIPAFEAYARERGLTVGVAAAPDCPPLVGVWRSKDWAEKRCLHFNEAVRRYLERSHVGAVVVAARWVAYTNGPQRLYDRGEAPLLSFSDTRAVFEKGLERTVRAARGRPVAIVEQVPEHDADIPAAYLVLHRLGLGLESIAVSRARHDRRTAEFRGAIERLTRRLEFAKITPADHLCRDGACEVAHAGRVLYRDNDHLNEAGSRRLGEFFSADLDRWLATSAKPQAVTLGR